jgi:hypothetical protein
MADLTEAVDGIVTTIAAIVYPNGTDAPSVGKCPIIVYQGWPEPQTLQSDLSRGKVHISAFPRPGGKVSTVMMGDTDWVEVDNSGTEGTGALEIERLTETVQVTIWASSPTLRDTIAKYLVPGMALVTRLAMPDGSQAIMTRSGAVQIDKDQKTNLYRRDLLYSINYATTLLVAQTAVQHRQLGISTGPLDDAQGPPLTIIT